MRIKVSTEIIAVKKDVTNARDLDRSAVRPVSEMAPTLQPGDSTAMKPERSTIDCSIAQHYAWSGVCDGWRYVDESDMSVIVERIPSGVSELTHLHRNVRQLFYVLEGQASLEVDGAVVRFGPGQAVHVPPGTTHRFFNSSPGDTRILVISSGPARNDRENVDVDSIPDPHDEEPG